MSTLNLGDSMHSSRQCPAESSTEHSRQEPPDSYGDFLPRLNIRVVSDPVDPVCPACGGPAATAAAATGSSIDVTHSANTPLTPATLAALGESRESRFDSWIEAVQYNNRIAGEGASVSAEVEDGAPPTGVDELIAVGEWCPVDGQEYPAMIESEDVLVEEDNMADWVEITHDEV